MSDLFPVTLDDLQIEVQRELKMRERVYPRLVASGKLTQDRSDLYIDHLSRVSKVLELLGSPTLLQEMLMKSDPKVYENRMYPGSIGLEVDWPKFVFQLIGQEVG